MTTIAKIKSTGVKAPITKATLIEARDTLQSIRQQQEELREEELKIRTFLADKLHTEEEGTKTMTIDGIKVTIGRSINRTISRDEAERMTQEHGDLSLEVIRWKPELKVGEFKKHPELEEYITSKPGPPTVEFK